MLEANKLYESVKKPVAATAQILQLKPCASMMETSCLRWPSIVGMWPVYLVGSKGHARSFRWRCWRCCFGACDPAMVGEAVQPVSSGQSRQARQSRQRSQCYCKVRQSSQFRESCRSRQCRQCASEEGGTSELPCSRAAGDRLARSLLPARRGLVQHDTEAILLAARKWRSRLARRRQADKRVSSSD